jgi:hypothetical protein
MLLGENVKKVKIVIKVIGVTIQLVLVGLVVLASLNSRVYLILRGRIKKMEKREFLVFAKYFFRGV